MHQMNAQAKYVPVNIPVNLMRRIEKLVVAQRGFPSATDYMTYVLRVILSRRPEESDYDLFSSRDLDEVRARLIALGSLSSSKKYGIEDLRSKKIAATMPPIRTKSRRKTQALSNTSQA